MRPIGVSARRGSRPLKSNATVSNLINLLRFIRFSSSSSHGNALSVVSRLARSYHQVAVYLVFLSRGIVPGLQFNAHLTHPGDIVFEHACKLGLEGIVSKRLGSTYRSGRSPDWLKFKNPEASAVKREAEEDGGK